MHSLSIEDADDELRALYWSDSTAAGQSFEDWFADGFRSDPGVSADQLDTSDDEWAEVEDGDESDDIDVPGFWPDFAGGDRGDGDDWHDDDGGCPEHGADHCALCDYEWDDDVDGDPFDGSPERGDFDSEEDYGQALLDWYGEHEYDAL